MDLTSFAAPCHACHIIIGIVIIIIIIIIIIGSSAADTCRCRHC